jgi:hypothetical protein
MILKDADHTELFERQKRDPNEEDARRLLTKVGKTYEDLITAELQLDFTEETTNRFSATRYKTHSHLVLAPGKARGETSGSANVRLRSLTARQYGCILRIRTNT